MQWEQYNVAIGFGVPVLVGIHVRMSKCWWTIMRSHHKPFRYHISVESEPRSTTKLIIMHEAHKALATRWPPSGYLLSGHLPPAFEGTYPKHVPQYHDYQLLRICYSGTCHHLSKDYFNRGTHASINYDKCICHVFTLRQQVFFWIH